MAKVRRAAHIVVQCPQDADSATVAAAMKRINDARKRVTEGVSKKVKKNGRLIWQRVVEDFGDVEISPYEMMIIMPFIEA